MISQVDNCLFIHIPKVAGQSIESAFLHRADLTWDMREQMLLKPNFDVKKGPPRLAHLTAREYVALGYLSQEQFDSMYKFAFVRNPWDRLVSEYTYRKYSCSFKDFLFKSFPTPKSDDYQRSFDGYRHVIPQVDFICDDNGVILVDFLGRFENINKDFAEVSLNITGESLELPFRNKTSDFKSWLNRIIRKNKKRTYTDYYDEESVEHVRSLYQKDIELFNYEFGK